MLLQDYFYQQRQADDCAQRVAADYDQVQQRLQSTKLQLQEAATDPAALGLFFGAGALVAATSDGYRRPINGLVRHHGWGLLHSCYQALIAE